MNQPPSDNLITVQNVSKTFVIGDEAIKALQNISFIVPKHSFTIIYGPSGSGKSTLLNTLVGLEPPDQGKVVIGGQDFYLLSRDGRANFRAQTIGMVYQTNYWVQSLNVQENIAMPLFLSGMAHGKANKIALEALTKVNMQEYAKRKPSFLSGGQQQRVSMARAIVADPPVIVADEPTGNLDTKNGDMIMNLLSFFKNEMKKTIILVTHNLEYLTLSDHQVHIKDGMLDEKHGSYETPESIIAQAKAKMQEMIKQRDQQKAVRDKSEAVEQKPVVVSLASAPSSKTTSKTAVPVTEVTAPLDGLSKKSHKKS